MNSIVFATAITVFSTLTMVPWFVITEFGISQILILLFEWVALYIAHSSIYS